MRLQIAQRWALSTVRPCLYKLECVCSMFVGGDVPQSLDTCTTTLVACTVRHSHCASTQILNSPRENVFLVLQCCV